jgi:hypothetical protein
LQKKLNFIKMKKLSRDEMKNVKGGLLVMCDIGVCEAKSIPGVRNCFCVKPSSCLCTAVSGA